MLETTRHVHEIDNHMKTFCDDVMCGGEYGASLRARGSVWSGEGF